jgi:hypothetical protein
MGDSSTPQPRQCGANDERSSASQARSIVRTFMRRVLTGELPNRLRNCVTGQLTENSARVPRGVRSFPASSDKGLRAAVFPWSVRSARRERSIRRHRVCRGENRRDPFGFSATGASAVNSSVADGARLDPSGWPGSLPDESEPVVVALNGMNALPRPIEQATAVKNSPPEANLVTFSVRSDKYPPQHDNHYLAPKASIRRASRAREGAA